MARSTIIALGLLLMTPSPGCAPERDRYEGPAPKERLILLFPSSERHLILEVSAADGDLDVGVDYDGAADSLELRIVSGSASWEGSRLAGSNMRLVACGIPAGAGRLVIVLKNHQKSSRMAALRVAPHKSDMCTPLAPVMDEFWAQRARSSPTVAEWSQ